MEMNLKNIIERIKQEGVGEAERKADEMISGAEKRAEAIVDAAMKEKEDITKKATEEAERLRRHAEEAMRQASRDVLLGLREQVVALFDGVVKREVAEQLSPKTLAEMIVWLARGMAKEGRFEVEVLLSREDKDGLEKILFDALKEEMKKGVTVKASPGVEHGFRIGEKEGNFYYDFTDEAISEAFKAYLNPRIAAMLSAGG